MSVTEKTRIIDELGEDTLLLPAKLNAALVANDHAKYFLSLFQAAQGRADNPDMSTDNLFSERQAAGVADPAFDLFVERAVKEADGIYRIPDAKALQDALFDALDMMLMPIAAAESSAVYEPFAKRLMTLKSAAPDFTNDQCPIGYVDAMTSGDRDKGDSLHILVMDMHKALNRLQAEIAEESIDGASVYQIADDDHDLIAAFMAGVQRTYALKCGHPGLGTTATRNGAKLLIQNDIGTTDAHVLVVTVEGLVTTVIYTDIHSDRLKFFESLFESFAMRWKGTANRKVRGFEKNAYYLGNGAYEAEDRDAQLEFLSFLGSRLVFLIDWNKARKRLRNFVKNQRAVDILKWAADHDLGHRAFLVLGGEHIIYEAIEYAAKSDIHYGERLDDVLGEGTTSEFLRFVLRTASQGLQAGRSDRLVKDEIKAELLKYFQSAHESLVAIAGKHAAFIYELANGLRDGLLRVSHAGGEDAVAKLARRAERWEKRADDLVNEGRAMSKRLSAPGFITSMLEVSDDAADNLEDAVYALSLLPQSKPSEAMLLPVRRLTDLAVHSARDFVRLVEAAVHIHRAGAREDLADFLEAIDRVVAAEHEADVAVRIVISTLINQSTSTNELYLLSDMAHRIESATDDLARASYLLREYVLEEVMSL